MDPESDFMDQATVAGLTDESVILLLTEHGWNRNEAAKAVARYRARSISAPIPAPRKTAESVGIDLFLNLASATMLCIAVVCGVNIASTLITEAFPTGDNTRVTYRDLMSNSAWFGIAAPIYLALMVILNRRLSRGLSRWSSPPRQWTTAVILFLGSMHVTYFAYEVLFAAISGKSELIVYALNFAIAAVVVGCVMVYYIRWLRGEPDQKEPVP